MLSVLGSGSQGNAFAFSSDGVTILVDAGFSVRTLKRRAASVGVDLSAVAAVILTHEHADHAQGAKRAATVAKCPLYASRGTVEALGPAGRPAVEIVAHLQTFNIGPFELTACQTAHDAAEPLALAVVGPQGEKVALAYDLGRVTRVLEYVLRSADCLVVESNHDEALLLSGPYPPSVRYRVGGPEGHLSNRDAARLLAQSWHPALATVVLAHISESCNRKYLAEQCAAGALRQMGYTGRLLLAEQDRALTPIEVQPA